ncbi:hypothetical protein Leryth_001370 [Lithospermum erythrorhizon]|nr:hypothetical protein Leryth_001370 [Lithospermum erythrorhizon]
MLGSVRRQSMSSLQQLEIEQRFPSKITKHDSLSIYEATLKKLQEGSQRPLRMLQEDPPSDISGSLATGCLTEETLTTEANCSPDSSVTSNVKFEMEPKSRNVSLVCLFSRYKTSQQAPRTPRGEAMLIESDSSASNSPSSDITS